MNQIPDIDQDALYAAADLVERTGARELTFGYRNEGVPVEQADWYATASHRDTQILSEHHRSPIEALEGLCQRLLTGAQCQRCGGLVALRDDGAVSYPGATRPDGTVWTKEEIDTAGQCRWQRKDRRWEPSCGFPPADTRHAPEGHDQIHTTEKLARALEAADRDGELRTMIVRARQGYYHDYLSPLALPATHLFSDLKERNHPQLAQRVRNGEFDASAAESAKWIRTEGEGIIAAMMSSPQSRNRAERRAKKKKRQGRSGCV